MVTALVGAQYGSEGKGGIAKHIAQDFEIHIRTGAPNAGHTIIHEGKPWKMRSIPCGWVNPDAFLVVGPGALLELDLLIEEVEALEEAGYSIRNRLYLDGKAGLIDIVRHQALEDGIRGRAHELIGSTGEGVGPARMAHMARSTFPADLAWAKIDHVGDILDWLTDAGIMVADTSTLVNEWINEGARVLLEGTQGSGLSLIHGYWPYCTSTDTNSGQLLVDAGISPQLLSRVILVARTFPIRVAGNSGPLKMETDWETLKLEPEKTTVTQKVRRVGHWDDELISRAIRLNRPCEIALTFIDYIAPEDKGKTTLTDLGSNSVNFIRRVEDIHQVLVSMVATGPDTVVDTLTERIPG